MDSFKFRTDTGIFVPAVSTDQMREIDRIAAEETGPNLFQMMENAGRSLSSLAIEMLGGGWKKARVVVLAGTGGNGGGGICAALHLANRNVNVRLCITQAERLEGVPLFQRKIFHSAGGREAALQEIQQGSADLILDAVIGYSLQSAPRGRALELIDWANSAKAPILSLDVPSGIDATTGLDAGGYVHPTQTLTLALPKTGLQPDKTGKLFLADIGIPHGLYSKIGISYTSPFDSRYVVPISGNG